MIRIAGLSFRYAGAPAPSLADVSLEIPDGELVVLAGASGSGKSTLARALTGLVPHFHGGEMTGTVEVYGADTRSTPPRALAGTVAFVAQDPESQGVVERVEDEVAFTMENIGVEPSLMRKRLEEALDALGLAALRGRPLSSLSGGERQRVAIASAVAAQPRCLVLDEPTSQLDPQSAEEVLAAVGRLSHDLGMTVVLVEHRLERVAATADRMVVLAGGRVVLDGDPRTVLASSSVAPPVAMLGRALRWEPLPLTIREGRAHAASMPRVHRRPISVAEAGEALLQARGIRAALGGREILRGIDLTVRAGETVAVVGRNGAGKTTLLRSLLGLQRLAAGDVTIAGMDVRATPVERLARVAGYLPQAAGALLFHDTVREELAFTLKGRGAGGDVAEALSEYGIAGLADAHPGDVSAGQRQRVAFAAATAGARVVLLDEPTRGVDYDGKERLAADLARWRTEGKACVLVTHDVELIAQAATRVVLMAGGEIVVDGPVREVLGESPLFSSQMNKVFGDRDILTVADALEAVGAT